MSKKPSSFGLLNRIYSGGLPHNLKYHYSCRELCLRYNALAASILLYDASKEKLVSKGTYFNRDGITTFNSPSQLYFKGASRYGKKHILKFIGFYHYLFYTYISTGMPDFVNDVEAGEIFDRFLDEKHLCYGFPSVLEYFDPSKSKDKFILGTSSDKVFIRKFVQYCIRNSWDNATDEFGKLDKTKFYYHLHRVLVEGEICDIGKDVLNYSGRIFHEFSNTSDDEDRILYLTETDFNQSHHKNFIQIFNTDFIEKLASLGFALRFQSYYVGIPLIANGRCIGVLRLLYPILKDGWKDKKSLIPAKDNTSAARFNMLIASGPSQIKRFLNGKLVTRSLLYTVQILGNFLNQNLLQEYTERIPRDVESIENDDSNTKYEYNKWCNNIQKGLNCSGSILRTVEGDNAIPEIKGFSENITNYIKQVVLDPDLDFISKGYKFHQELEKVFPRVNQREKNNSTLKAKAIVAFIIDLGDSYESAEIIKYFYATIENQKEVIRSIDSLSELSDSSYKEILLTSKKAKDNPLLTTKYYDFLTGKTIANQFAYFHKPQYLMIIDVPASDVSGVATFTNTQNRRFDLSDVRFAYGQIKRLGLGMSLRNKKYTTLAMRSSLHSMSHLVRELDKIIVLTTGKLKPNEIKSLEHSKSKYQHKCDELNMWLGNSEVYREERKDPSKKEYCLVDFINRKLINHHCTFEAESKGIKIEVKSNIGKKVLTNVNSLCIWTCIESLLENAIHYSFYFEDIINPSHENFIQEFVNNTDGVGDIRIIIDKIKGNENKNLIKISVLNVGKPIDTETAHLLGTCYYSFDDTKGERGQGLYLVKRYLEEFLKSKWLPPKALPHGSKFSFTIQRFTYEKNISTRRR